MEEATPEDIVSTLSFALRYEGRKRVLTGDEFMAKITAERLLRHLQRSGFVLMKKPPAPLHSTHGIPGGHSNEMLQRSLACDNSDGGIK